MKKQTYSARHMPDELLEMMEAEFAHLPVHERTMIIRRICKKTNWDTTLSQLNDILIIAINETTSAKLPNNRNSVEPQAGDLHIAPLLGEFLICLFVSPERQNEKLGDMEEYFTTIWVPRHGLRCAQFIYIWHALGCAARLAKGAVIAAIADKVFKLIQSFK